MRSKRGIEAAAAAAMFALLTVVFTWPLAAGITHLVPSDFGDPLLNSWILAWDASHFGRGWWNANIFYPNPLALGYSEHLAAQAASIAPIYWMTGNAILCYNLVFFATFVLSGLGVFLLARALRVSTPAAFVAGMAYAFTPYRVSSLPHIQVLSSAWMPFVILGFRRYFDTGRTRALAVAAAAWVLQNLSCGYYLLFFAPVVAIYVCWELTVRGLWSNRRATGSMAIVAMAVGIITMPFLLPYLELRTLGFLPRSLFETGKFSADVYGYLTVDPNLRLWGSIVRAWPKAEGALFPGVTITVLAALGSLGGVGEAAGSLGVPQSGPLLARRAVTTAVLVTKIILIMLLLGISIRLPIVKITSLSRTLVVASIGAALLLTVSRDARNRSLAWLRSSSGVFAMVTVFAAAMSFGPQIRAMDRLVLDTNLYAFFYAFVPGFDGLRVPARFAMIVMLGLAVLGALGLERLRAWFEVRSPGGRNRRVWLVTATAGALIAIESFAAPIPVDGNSTSYTRPGLAPLPALQLDAAPVYGFIASLPPASAIVELPLGEPAFDVRYMYYSTRHWRRLVNGYSGGMPPSYEQLDLALQDLLTRPERAWEVLVQHKPTHAIVHDAYYAGDGGARVGEWLLAHGATEITVAGTDHVFQLPDRQYSGEATKTGR